MKYARLDALLKLADLAVRSTNRDEPGRQSVAAQFQLIATHEQSHRATDEFVRGSKRCQAPVI